MVILREIDKVFRDIQRAQQTPYRFRWNNKIHYLLKSKVNDSSYCTDSDILEKRSRRLEPEIKEGGTFEI